MKLTINNILFSLLIFILGCSDYQINKVVERAPDISVYPENHDSGYLLAGQEISEFSITVSNVGNEKLEIADIYLDNVYSNFEILSETQLTIEPAGFSEILLRYKPKTFETNDTVIKIISNDPDERLVEISINGAGDAPVIDITPDYFSFDDFGFLWARLKKFDYLNVLIQVPDLEESGKFKQFNDNGMFNVFAFNEDSITIHFEADKELLETISRNGIEYKRKSQKWFIDRNSGNYTATSDSSMNVPIGELTELGNTTEKLSGSCELYDPSKKKF